MKNIPKIGCSGKSSESRARKSGRGKTGNGRLSKEHLRDLRNKIPIRRLIENELGVRCHTEAGIFRFECPLCGSFHTSVMKTENIGRCFGCETTFNTIDMVMEIGKTGFRQSADFLTDILEFRVTEKPVASPARGPTGLVSLSSVLTDMAEPLPEGIAEPRIQSLEKEIAKLGNRMDRLQQFLVEILSKRGAWHGKVGKTDG